MFYGLSVKWNELEKDLVYSLQDGPELVKGT